MSLYTGFDQDAPPAFRQGMSGVSRLVLFVILCFALMGLDKRTDLGHYVRFAVRAVFDPVTLGLTWPGVVVTQMRASWDTFIDTESTRKTLDAQKLALSQNVQALAPLQSENARLRALLHLRTAQATTPSIAADVLSEVIDAFSQRVIINRGMLHGVVVGAPVIDELGLVGQVVEVYSQTSTVRTVSDRNFAIALVNGRSQERSLAVGIGQRGSDMELRYAVAHDVLVGDTYYTSGLDNIYPPYLAVGTIDKIDRRANAVFVRITLKAVARFRQGLQVLVLQPVPRMPPASTPAIASSPTPKAAAKKATSGNHP